MKWKLLALAVVAAAAMTWIVVPDICSRLTPDDTPWYWLFGCEKDSAGGGGGGVG